MHSLVGLRGFLFKQLCKLRYVGFGIKGHRGKYWSRTVVVPSEAAGASPGSYYLRNPINICNIHIHYLQLNSRHGYQPKGTYYVIHKSGKRVNTSQLLCLPES